MANGNDWQCIHCGDHPTQFSGGKPNSGIKCKANGHNHVWEMLKDGTTNSRDWQCRNCGAHPTSWSGKKPSSSGKCSVTGFKHIWSQI